VLENKKSEAFDLALCSYYFYFKNYLSGVRGLWIPKAIKINVAKIKVGR
jgi:hypothetical protein